jgi:rhodanese-related sulfurtransferase
MSNYIIKLFKMENLTNERWKELVASTENAVVLDVRTTEECVQGILANAKQINFLAGHEFVAEIEKLDKSKTYFIYCRSGNRSGQACNFMQTKGFKTYNLLSGIMRWNGAIVNP